MSGTTQPADELQIRHGSHWRGVPSTQTPPEQVSPTVQESPSSQLAPSGPIVWQSLEQQSPSAALPSSQTSPGSRRPFPQIEQISRLQLWSVPVSLERLS